MSHPTTPFDKRAIAAVELAQANTEFVLSPAQREQALQPLVTELLSMKAIDAWDYIRASFGGTGPESIAVSMFKTQRVAHDSMVAESVQNLKKGELPLKRESVHIDNWIITAAMSGDESVQYAGFFFHLHRLPAVMEMAWHKFVPNLTLFCTYEGVRYRVTGASRMGDVWLQPDFTKENGYTKRVDVAACNNWSREQ